LTPWRHRNTGIVRAVTCLPAQVIEGLGEGIGEQHVRKEDDGPDEGAHEEEDADGQAHSLALHLNLSKLGVGRQLVRVVILYGAQGNVITLHGRSESTANTCAQHSSHPALPAIARRRWPAAGTVPGQPRRAAFDGSAMAGAGASAGASPPQTHSTWPRPRPRAARRAGGARRTGQATLPPSQPPLFRSSRAPRVAAAKAPRGAAGG